jgi:hypothetical protein
MPMARKIQVIPSGAPLGAEIVGVDLSEVIDDQSFQAIDAAYHERTVIVFRDQTLTPAQHLRFARRFGELEVSPCTQFALPGCPEVLLLSKPGCPEVLLLSNILDANGRPIGNADADGPGTPTCPIRPHRRGARCSMPSRSPTTSAGKCWATPSSSAPRPPMRGNGRDGARRHNEDRNFLKTRLLESAL